ncbi:MAG: outer membrane beta-barrel protein [Cyclobacteriaceae bacterium]
MKVQFDKRLVDKIKDSFKTHEESFDPVQWEKLSKAYFKPKRKGWVVYWPFISAGVAASLILVLFYFPFEQTLERKVKTLADSIDNGPQPLTELKGLPEETAESLKSGGSSISQPDSPATIEGDNKEVISGTNREIPAENQNYKANAGRKSQKENPKLLETLEEKWKKFQTGLDLKMLGALDFGRMDNQREKHDLTEEEAQQMIALWKAENSSRFDEPGKSQKTDSPIKLGVMVSPQSNSNPVSGMNFGGGIMSEFSLSRKIKLDVGLAYASQSISPQNIQSMPRSAANQEASFSSGFVGSDYELNFASLDIPINLKYKIFDRKSTGIYLITGISSMLYLDQNSVETVQTNSLFSTDNRNGELQFAQSVQEFSTVLTPQPGENAADFAGLLNLSFGYEYTLNKGFNISLEPFYKLPLGGLTFADQRFSIGGVNLRMNFNLKK